MKNNQYEMIDCIQRHNETEQNRKNNAEANRDMGITTAIDHAEGECSGWGEKAYNALLTFLRCFPDREFMAEEAREWAESKGVPLPPNKRAWGAIFIKASKKGILAFCGYAKTVNPLAHRTPAALWAAAKEARA